MAASHEIKCINKQDRKNIYERIINIGGINYNSTRWKISQQKAIEGIEDKTWEFYVGQGDKKVMVIIGISAEGYKYLKTEKDTTTVNNLLSLPECP